MRAGVVVVERVLQCNSYPQGPRLFVGQAKRELNI